MNDRDMIIVGGGLAGLSAGCYALRNGYRTTIIEHNHALGGVCTSWQRGPYTVDGCIHWLTGGPFERLYRELDIVPRVPLRILDTWMTYRNARDGFQVAFTRDLDALVAQLAAVSPEDRGELERLRHGAVEMLALEPPIDVPSLPNVRNSLRALWDMRGAVGPLLHFRQSTGEWARHHLRSPRLQRIFSQLFPPSAPAFFMLMVLGYLERGYLSRPAGGTAAFRDALVHNYRAEGGETLLHATVDEILTHEGRARGVRLADGRMLTGDLVISTASTPETVLRLLGGRYDADATRQRLANWQLFDPIVLASFGAARPFADAPGMLFLDEIQPLMCGDRKVDHLYVRVCNDDPGFAPEGHCVVQAMIPTSYEWWATRGPQYTLEKQALAEQTLARLEPHFPGLGSAMRVTDLATPLTYWNMAHSWRGAYEGWMPTDGSFFGHVPKVLDGLDGLYLAGQWVEPGGGVPMAVMSGRQAVQLICRDRQRTFLHQRAPASVARSA